MAAHKHTKMEDVSYTDLLCQALSTIYSQEILQATLGKLRQNIVKKQVAAGREFKVLI